MRDSTLGPACSTTKLHISECLGNIVQHHFHVITQSKTNAFDGTSMKLSQQVVNLSRNTLSLTSCCQSLRFAFPKEFSCFKW